MTFVKELFYINKINPFSILPLQYDETVPQYAFLNPYAYYLLYEWQQEAQNMYKTYQSDLVFLSAEMKSKREEEIVKKEQEAQDLKRKY